MLTDTKLRNLKPRDKLYKVNDRDGLYVAVTPAGAVSFRYNYSLNGRQETTTFGRYGVGGIILALMSVSSIASVAHTVCLLHWFSDAWLMLIKSRILCNFPRTAAFGILIVIEKHITLCA